MTDKEFEIFSHFMTNFKRQWDMNEYARDNYNEELEHFVGYRNKDDYPMAYNMVVNKLLPRVETMLGRCMDQLFQPAAHNIIGVRARNSQNYQGAACSWWYVYVPQKMDRDNFLDGYRYSKTILEKRRTHHA